MLFWKVKKKEKLVMSGKLIVIGLIGFSFIFGLVVYYFQVFSYYSRVEGLSHIFVDGKKIEVSDYNGLDSSVSGLKLRGCFKTDVKEFVEFQKFERPTPLAAPFWFKCFDYENIQKSLTKNLAKSFIAQENELDGIDRIVAIFPDGTGYQWRQLNAKYMD